MPEERKTVDVGETMGMIRSVDELGRFVIPIEFRNALDIVAEEKPKVEAFLLEDGIFVRPAKFKYKKQK